MKKFILVANAEEAKNYFLRKQKELKAELRFGNVTYHKELLEDSNEKCLGGGIFEIENDRLIMSGCSFDYGYPPFEMDGLKISCPQECIKEVMIYTMIGEPYPYNQQEDVDVRKLLKISGN